MRMNGTTAVDDCVGVIGGVVEAYRFVCGQA